MKRILFAFLVILMMLGLALSCTSCGEGSSDGADTGDNTQQGGTENPPVDDEPSENLVLIDENKANFQIVITSETDGSVRKAVENFVSDLQDIGVDVEKLVSDSASEVRECEIIVGTNVKGREAKYVLDPHDYGADGYVIKIVDDKVLIGGGTVEQTKTAFDYFVKNVVKLTSKTKEMEKLEVERSYERLKETKYLIDSVKVAGNDLSEYVFVTDLANATNPNIRKLRQNLYDQTGYWLDLVKSEDELPEGKRAFIIRNVDDAGEKGFRAYVNSDADFIVECAYANATDEAVAALMKSTVFDKLGDVTISKSFEKNYPVNVVYYAQFGAKGDGQTEDFEAIYNTHVFANEGGQKVMGDGPDARYYIHVFNKTIPVKTDVDFNGSTFYLDDRGSEIFNVRGYALFGIEREHKAVVFNESQIASNPDFAGKTLKFGDTEIPWIAKYIEATSLVVFLNNHKDFIRHGANINSGQQRQDTVVIEPDGKLHDDTPVIWDFEPGYQLMNNGLKLESVYTPAFTSIRIFRVDDTPITIENGRFERDACGVVAETEFKNVYKSYSRGIAIARANTTVKNLTHKILSEPYLPTSGYGWNETGTAISQSYPYGGFLVFGATYNSQAIDCNLNAHTTYYEAKTTSATPVAMGTYDLNITGSCNVYLEGLTNGVDHRDSQYWGIMHSNKSKNLDFKDCVLSRFDAHEGFWNASFIDCEFGRYINVIGGGYLYIENTTRCVGGNFISLRGDYGSTFNGTIELVDCTFQGFKEFRGGASDLNYEVPISGSTLVVIGGGYSESYIGAYQEGNAGAFPFLKWDFGYTCYHPQKVIIDNFNCLVADRNKLNVFKDVGDKCFIRPDDFVQTQDYEGKVIVGPNGERPMTANDIYYNQYMMTQEIVFRNMKPLNICNNESSYLYTYLTEHMTVINPPEE